MADEPANELQNNDPSIPVDAAAPHSVYTPEQLEQLGKAEAAYVQQQADEATLPSAEDERQEYLKAARALSDEDLTQKITELENKLAHQRILMTAITEEMNKRAREDKKDFSTSSEEDALAPRWEGAEPPTEEQQKKFDDEKKDWNFFRDMIADFSTEELPDRFGDYQEGVDMLEAELYADREEVDIRQEKKNPHKKNVGGGDWLPDIVRPDGQDLNIDIPERLRTDKAFREVYYDCLKKSGVSEDQYGHLRGTHTPCANEALRPLPDKPKR